MIPRHLILQNFLSYGEEPQELDFTTFHVACLSGANGHGKSALLDAITWALWGQARKGRNDRKPDEGLLRLGAQQMRVTFTFDLDDGTYRVHRSFRRRPRSNITELDLHVLDPESDTYRPLAEAGAVSVTQNRIDTLLSMDYETFTNSAFLLQGQAGAFTSKGARDRKDLLGRVLGLARYDQLQEAARGNQQQRQHELNAVVQRIDAIAQDLPTRADVDRQVADCEQLLTSLSQDLDRAQADWQLWHERQLRADSLRQDVGRCRVDLTDIEATLERLRQDLARLQERRQADAAVLAEAERTEADVVRLANLQIDVRRMETDRAAIQDIDAALSEVQRRLEGARHQVDQRRATWTSRRDSLDERLRSFDDVLQQAQVIETAFAQLEQDRSRLDVARRQQRQFDELQSQCAKQTHAIELEQRRLDERLLGTQSRLREIQQRLAESAQVTQQLETAEAELEAAGKRDDEMRRLREEGTGIRAQADLVRQRLSELDTESQNLTERIAAVGRGDLAECPLCGTDLDDDHRHRIDAELSQAETELAGRRHDLTQRAALLDEQLSDLRDRFRQRESEPLDLASLQERVALLRARRGRIEEEEATAATLMSEAAQLERRLRTAQFAQQARDEQQRLQAAIDELAFDAAQLVTLEKAVREGSDIETRHRLLQGARQDRLQTEKERAQAHEHVNAAERELSTQSYRQAFADEIASLQQNRAAINYDGQGHDKLRRDVEALSDAPVRMERVRAARERQTTIADEQHRLAAEQASAQSKREQLVQRRDELLADLASLQDAADNVRQADARRTDLRQRRDETLQLRGTLQARARHLAQLAQESVTLTEKRQRLEREEWLYAQLVEAFGKDGIQALVIENAIPEIEEEANAILSRLTDNRIQVAIESLRDLKSGGSRETLDVKISDEMGERAYDLYSGGEAFRTDFALRIALSKILARRAGTRLRTLIIDEGFGTQDAEGLDRLRDAIGQISDDFDKILVVTHLEELKNAFPVRIEIDKDPDLGSRLRIVT